MPKRPTIKGKGADIFLDDSSKDNSAPPSKTTKPYVRKTKVTFYLPDGLVDDLEETWLNLRKSTKGKRVDKSSIVKVALEGAIREYKEGKNNSTLANHFTSKS